GAVLGGRWLEETTGTNSIATSHELRRGVTVRGEEHYLEALKKYTCYGRPVLSPVNRRLEGVVDVTCLATDDHPLLGPMLARAVREIERRLRDSAGLADQRLLAAFQRVTAAAVPARSAPVLALGEGIVLATPQALELLDIADHATLWALAEDTRADSESTRSCTFEPAHGGPVLLRWRKLPEWGGGAVFELSEAAPARRGPLTQPVAPTCASVPAAQASQLRELAGEGSAVLVAGEPGTGHDSALALLSGTARVVRFHADEHEPRRTTGWLPTLGDALRVGDTLVVLDSIHLLTEREAHWIARVLHEAPATARLAMTCGPAHELRGERLALAAHCAARVELLPLRARRTDIPALIRHLLVQLDADP
ncbi:hypothetical protein ACFRI7_39170, partial [Streptomyces sp. NPDC056716]